MAKNEYTVYRRFRDFKQLHEKLEDRYVENVVFLEGRINNRQCMFGFYVFRYADSCMIIPPPPSKSSVKSVSVKIKGDTDSDSLGRTIGKFYSVFKQTK